MTAKKILEEATRLEGHAFWSNACAYVVDKVLYAAGIDVRTLYNVINQNWVPDWEKKVGRVVSSTEAEPGDLVFTMWSDTLQNHGHIGIYAGKGQYFNVSTSAGYKWVVTSVPNQTNVVYRRVALENVASTAKGRIITKLFFNDGKATRIFDGKPYRVLSINAGVEELEKA